MELDNSYNLNFLHVEKSIAQSYRDGISELRESEDPDKVSGIIVDMFNNLGESRPLRGAGVEWASEIIPAYRNLARILKEMPHQEYYLSSLFSKYSDLFDSYEEDLIMKVTSRPTQLERALTELEKIKNILDKNGISSLEDLENILESPDPGELKEKIREYEQNSKKLEDL